MTIRTELKRFERRWLRPIYHRVKNKKPLGGSCPDPGSSGTGSSGTGSSGTGSSGTGSSGTGSSGTGSSGTAIAAEMESLVDERILLRSELAALQNRFLELELRVEKIDALRPAGVPLDSAVTDTPLR
jgi:hypothetical protein